MPNIKEIALRIAGDFIKDAIGKQNIIEFAEALIAEIQEQNKPVAWLSQESEGGRICLDVEDSGESGNWSPSFPVFIFPPSTEPQWRTIETAPKDGRVIVVGYGRQSNFPVKVVYWKELHKIWMHYGEWEPGLENNATHWMPLPTPPKRSMEGV